MDGWRTVDKQRNERDKDRRRQREKKNLSQEAKENEENLRARE